VAVNTVLHNTPQSFPEGPGHTFSHGRQNMPRQLWHTPKIYRKISGELKFCFVVIRAGRKSHWYILRLWFNSFAESFFKALGMHFSSEGKERDVAVVRSCSHLSLLVYGDDFPIFWSLSRTPGHLTHTNKPKNSSVQDFEHFRSNFIECLDN